MPARGRLITIEGLDGAGKTLLAGRLADALGAQRLREPGGVEAAERIRDLVKDPLLEVGPRAEALLFAAARAELVAQRLRPALEAGHDVVADRFVDSSLAYQGAGRELGVDAVAALNAFALQGLRPDLTLLLRVRPSVGRARQTGRGEADRLEREDEAFFARVARAYDALADAEPQRVRVIDGEREPDVVLADAVRTCREVLARA